MDRPTSLREHVVGEAAARQGLEAVLLEIVEMDGVVDVAERVQLVSASIDYRFSDAQCPSPSIREKRGWVGPCPFKMPCPLPLARIAVASVPARR
jgi:hypothetical protein